MAINRRSVLLGGVALGAAGFSRRSWAGTPVGYLATAAHANGGFTLEAIARDGTIIRSIPLPGRGHGVAVRPDRREAIVFARRPGAFAIAVDLETWRQTEITSLGGRHFYGHGVYSEDGRTLFTTENAYEAGEGRVGIYDASSGYKRVGEFATGGIGPHEIRRRGTRLVIANGGIRTHPDQQRQKLNLDSMTPSIVWLDVQTGKVLSQLAMPDSWHQVSLRHFAIVPEGVVLVGGQWQGRRGVKAPLLWRADPSAAALQPFVAEPEDEQPFRGYVASVAIDPGGQFVAATSPRGGVLTIWRIATGEKVEQLSLSDVSGVAGAPQSHGFMVAGDTGKLMQVDNLDGDVHTIPAVASSSVLWDNHLTAI